VFDFHSLLTWQYEEGLPLLKHAIERGKSAVASAHSESFGHLSLTSMALYGAKNLFANDNFFVCSFIWRVFGFCFVLLTLLFCLFVSGYYNF
jgi:hypothetical protein